MVGFIKPHHPFDPPEPWAGMYNPEKLELLPGWLEDFFPHDLERHTGYFPYKDMSEKILRKIMAYYYATISQIDAQVGRMVELLKKNGIFENTLILYTSDHGDYMGFHRMVLKQNYMYDPVVRIPLIIKYSGNQNSDIKNNHLSCNVDVAPTVLKQAGLEIPASMKGIDLSDSKAGREYVFSESWGHMEYMVRSNTHKLLLCKDDKKSQFFDLIKDPIEKNNLYNDIASCAEVEKYKNTLMRWLLFDEPAGVHLDTNAPVISRPGGSQWCGQCAKESEFYFNEKMKTYIFDSR